MRGSRVTALGIVLLASTFLSGCSGPEPVSIGVDADDVATVELYDYAWADKPESVRRLAIVNNEANREVVQELVKMFTDVPTTAVPQGITEEMVGAPALGARYTLDDGSAVEVTRIFVARHDVIVIWPDGSANHTEWGSPDTFAYYSEFGVVDEVDAEERPSAKLPE